MDRVDLGRDGRRRTFFSFRDSHARHDACLKRGRFGYFQNRPLPPPRGSEAVARGSPLAAGFTLVPSSAFGLRVIGGRKSVGALGLAPPEQGDENRQYSQILGVPAAVSSQGQRDAVAVVVAAPQASRIRHPQRVSATRSDRPAIQ